MASAQSQSAYSNIYSNDTLTPCMAVRITTLQQNSYRSSPGLGLLCTPRHCATPPILFGRKVVTMSAAAGPDAAAPDDTTPRTQGTDAVHILYEPKTGTPTFDVLFFHGLQPWSYKQAWKHTWENADGVLWPAEWLGKQDFPTARVMSICYDSRALLGQTDMNEIGNILVNEICNLVEVGQGRPVVLVGHSLGGLVLKQLALEAKKQAAREKQVKGFQDRCKAFYDNLAGAFFYATPHGGAILGSFAKTVLGWFGAGGPVLKYLTVFSSEGADLNRDFADAFGNRLRFTALVERQPYKPLGWLPLSVKVVKEGAAKQYMDNPVEMSGADHISICKPKGPGDGSYLHLKVYIKDVLKDFQNRLQEGGQQQPLPVPLDVSKEVSDLQTRRYKTEVQPALNWIKNQKKRLEKSLGDRWAEGLFPHDVEVDHLPVTQHREVTRDYWRDVLHLCKGRHLGDDFFMSANMAGRAQEYRLLVEPIDIANYYHANFHRDKPGKKSRGHYIDGISTEEELEKDNHIRPGRYLQLQQIEQRILPQKEPGYEMQSSLDLARELKTRVGGLEWAEYQKQQGSASGCSIQ